MERIDRLEALIGTVVIPKAKEGLPENFDDKALEGLSLEGQVEFLTRFKAALPASGSTETKKRQVGAEIPQKKTEADSAPTPGSMVERAARAKEIMLENRKNGKPGLVGNEVFI